MEPGAMISKALKMGNFTIQKRGKKTARMDLSSCIIIKMDAKINLDSRLKEACQLTGASWAAVVHQDSGSWQLGSAFHLSLSRHSRLNIVVERSDFASWMMTALSGEKPRSRVITRKDNLDCQRVYAFPFSKTAIILAGAKDTLSADHLRIWKLASLTIEVAPKLPADQEVGLLQHTVMELQQTQQELQARISAQREAEARLIQAAKLAAVGEMAAGVAHELNNPLTSVVGFTELALDELPVDSTVRGDLELVLKEARRARSVVRRLLDFARQAETIRVKADINEIVDDVLMLTKHLMQSSNVKPEIRLGENLAWVSVDRNQIKQVVINLVNNALYAMPDGGRIVVETQEQIRFGRNWLKLSIRDNGVGISPENLERIFEPFFTTRGDRGGTGLGLSVTYGIVTDHGGMIEVESQVKVGSTFIVWLPMEQAL
jgi:signal transduction histidine kinase